nr:MAG TPA: hypothetical protein [Bacteriophage sp.]
MKPYKHLYLMMVFLLKKEEEYNKKETCKTKMQQRKAAQNSFCK